MRQVGRSKEARKMQRALEPPEWRKRGREYSSDEDGDGPGWDQVAVVLRQKIEEDIRGDMDKRQVIYRRYRTASGHWETTRRKWARLLIDKAEDDLA